MSIFCLKVLITSDSHFLRITHVLARSTRVIFISQQFLGDSMVSDDDYAAVKKVKGIEEKFGRKAAGKYCRHFYGQCLEAFYTSHIMGMVYDINGPGKEVSRLVDDILKATDTHIARLKAVNASLEDWIHTEEAKRELAARGHNLDG